MSNENGKLETITDKVIDKSVEKKITHVKLVLTGGDNREINFWVNNVDSFDLIYEAVDNANIEKLFINDEEIDQFNGDVMSKLENKF